MSPFANAPHLRLDVSRPKRSLEVLSCKGAEVLNQPYSFELEVVSHEGPLDAHDLLFSVAYLHSSAGRSETSVFLSPLAAGFPADQPCEQCFTACAIDSREG